MTTTHNQEPADDGTPNNNTEEPTPTDLVSVQAAGKLTGRNTNTFYFWIKGGLLKKYSSLDGETLVSTAQVLELHSSKQPRPRKSKSQVSEAAVTPFEETAPENQTPVIAEGTPPGDVIAEPTADGVAPQPVPVTAAGDSVKAVVSEPARIVSISEASTGDAVERKVEIRLICFDPDTQMRAQMDQKVVQEYAEKMKTAVRFPPVILFEDDQGRLFIGDGWHRLGAAKRNKYHHFPAEVRAGGRSAAMRYALRANVTHGLRLTSRDKRRKVTTAFREYPNVSNNEIASICGVSESLVRSIRDRFAKNEPAVRTGADGKQYPARKSQRPKGKSKQNAIFKRTTDLVQKLTTVDRLERLKAMLEEQIKRLRSGGAHPAVEASKG